MDEFSAHARGPLRHALRVVDGLGLADTDEESEPQQGDDPLVARMDLEQHVEFAYYLNFFISIEPTCC